MNVPIEIVRRGKSEEYVRLQDMLNELKSKYMSTCERFGEAIREMVGYTYGTERSYHQGHAYVAHTGKVRGPNKDGISVETNVWTYSQMIQNTSESLTELAGELVDINVEIAKVESELRRLM